MLSPWFSLDSRPFVFQARSPKVWWGSRCGRVLEARGVSLSCSFTEPKYVAAMIENEVLRNSQMPQVWTLPAQWLSESTKTREFFPRGLPTINWEECEVNRKIFTCLKLVFLLPVEVRLKNIQFELKNIKAIFCTPNYCGKIKFIPDAQFTKVVLIWWYKELEVTYSDYRLIFYWIKERSINWQQVF